MKAPKVPRLRFRVKCHKKWFQVKVPSEGSEGSQVPGEGSVSNVQKVPKYRFQAKVPSEGSEGSK